MLKEIIVKCKDGEEFGSRALGFRHWLLSETEKTFTRLTQDNIGRLSIIELPKSRYGYEAEKT